MVSQFTIKSPAQIASDENHVVSSINYVDHEGNTRNGVAISPNINFDSLVPSIDLTSAADEQSL
jgi:hypothetical protein